MVTKNRMTAKQIMMQAITQTDTKEAITPGKETENPVDTAKLGQVIPRTGGLALKQPTFNWKAADKYKEL